jgi:hypothetical protein
MRLLFELFIIGVVALSGICAWSVLGLSKGWLALFLP